MDTVDVTLSNADLWTLVVGFFLPPIIAVVQQRGWSSEVKSAFMFAVCLVVAGVTLFFQNAVEWSDYPRALLLVFVSAQASYRGWWKPSGVTDKVESATSAK